MIQRILGDALLALGLIYGAVLLCRGWKARKALRQGTSLLTVGACEAAVFFIASLGISDFLQNTLVSKKLRLAGDKELPGTLVACSLTPGAIIARSLLGADHPVSAATLIPCGIAVIAGSLAGAKLVSGIEGGRLKKIMRFALIGSFLVLLVKTILTAGAAGTATDLHGWRVWLAAGLCLVTGVLNMFGIPMKPVWTAIFLLLGLSPLSTLTMVLVMGSLSPLSGGAKVLQSGNYHLKMAVCAVLFGSLGAILGTVLAISLPAGLLNGILIAVMLVAIIAMFRN